QWNHWRLTIDDLPIPRTRHEFTSPSFSILPTRKIFDLEIIWTTFATFAPLRLFPHKFKSSLRQSGFPSRPKTSHSFILIPIVPSGLSFCIDTLRWVETHRCNIIVLSGLSQH